MKIMRMCELIKSEYTNSLLESVIHELSVITPSPRYDAWGGGGGYTLFSYTSEEIHSAKIVLTRASMAS